MENTIMPLFDIYNVKDADKINLYEQYEVVLPVSALTNITNSNIEYIDIGQENHFVGSNMFNILNYVHASYNRNDFENKIFTVIYVKDISTLPAITNLKIKFQFNKEDETLPTIIML